MNANRTTDKRSGEQGQAIMVLAISMIALMGFMGLVTDVGWGLFQKRLAQNAADAAALAGARALAVVTSCNNTTLQTTIDGLVTNYVQLNGSAGATDTWQYIDNNGNTVASTSACTSATGIRVSTQIPYNNFFLGILGITSSTTSAIAASRVGVLQGFKGGSPFIACGSALVRTSDNVQVNVINSSTNPPTLNSAYIGTTFNLHGSQHVGDCGLGGADFKGNASNDQAGCDSLACNYESQSGDRAGPTQVRVAGAAPGCSGTVFNNCVLIVPLADGVGSSSTSLHVIAWAGFLVQDSSNSGNGSSHTGVLLSPIFTTGRAGNWTPGSGGLLVLSLVQ